MAPKSMFKLPGSSKSKGKDIGSGSTKRMSRLEKDRLYELIDVHGKVIECKKTDHESVRSKKAAWEDIRAQFSSTPGCESRTVKQLTDWWKNAKSRSKKEVGQQKQSRRKTGGGPSSQPELSEDAQRVAAIVPEQMHSLKNPYDCDGIGIEVDSEDELLSPSEPPPATTTVSNGGASRVTDGSGTSANDGTGDSSCVNESTGSDSVEPPAKRKKAPSKSAQLRDARHTLVEMEEEEHKVRLDTVQLENQTVRANLEKLQMEKAFLEEEHKLRMDFLRSQQQSSNQYSSFGSNCWSSFQQPPADANPFMPYR